MIVRPAAPYDYKQLCGVIKEVDDFHSAAIPRFFRPNLGAARPLQWLMDILNNTEMNLLVAEEDGKIVGFLWGILRNAPDTPFHTPRRYLLVDMLGVTESHRGKGIGRALMEAAEKWAKAQGVTQVELTMWDFNEGARAMYDKMGYETVQRRLWKSLED
jgi:diamine N-acetyltransferase